MDGPLHSFINHALMVVIRTTKGVLDLSGYVNKNVVTPSDCDRLLLRHYMECRDQQCDHACCKIQIGSQVHRAALDWSTNSIIAIVEGAIGGDRLVMTENDKILNAIGIRKKTRLAINAVSSLLFGATELYESDVTIFAACVGSSHNATNLAIRAASQRFIERSSNRDLTFAFNRALNSSDV